MRFGIHTGPQLCTIDQLRELWRFADDNGFHWVSIWDHFYPAQLTGHDGPCLEAVATHAALACETRHVRVGCLVYCVGYRHPAVLAKALATIDHLSGGRMECGLGAGWHQNEFEAFGLPFPPIGVRLSQLDEAAQIVRSMFDQPQTTFHGKHYKVEAAFAEPKPVQPHARLWIGGGGEKRLLRMVARRADGWNIPFVAPQAFAHKNKILSEWCEREKRDPAAILRTVNLGLALAESERELPRLEAHLEQQFGAALPMLRAGMLLGTPEQAIARIEEYRRAGADWVIVALRAPFDLTALRLFVERVMPAFC